MLVIAEARGADASYSNYLLRYPPIRRAVDLHDGRENVRGHAAEDHPPGGADWLDRDDHRRLTPSGERDPAAVGDGHRHSPADPRHPSQHGCPSAASAGVRRLACPAGVDRALGQPSGDLFRRRLASLVPPVATRLRRDFSIVLTLIEAHALLHQGTGPAIKTDASWRPRLTTQPCISWRLNSCPRVSPLTVPALVRETVEAVRRIGAGGNAVSLYALANDLKIDQSTASRRAARAEHLGYITSIKDGRNRNLNLGTPLPMNRTLLPDVTELFASTAATPVHPVAGVTERITVHDAIDVEISSESLSWTSL